MSRIWKMSRSRVFSAGSKLFTTITRAQPGTMSKIYRVDGVNRIFLVESFLGAPAIHFCRPFSLGTDILSLNYEVLESKSNGLIKDCEGKSWNVDAECLSAFCNETTLPLVHEAVEVMQPSAAKELFKLAAATQDVPKFTRYLHNLLFRIFLQAGRFNMAVDVLEEMKKSEVPVNLKSFSTLAFFYMKAGMKTEAEETLDLMKSFGFTRKQDLYRVLLGEYLVAGDEEGIERLLERCSESRDLDSALKVIAELGKGELTLKVLNMMEAASIDLSKSAFLTVTKCLCDTNMIDEALKLVKKGQEKGLLRSVKVSNILIGSFIRENKLDEALKVISDMKSTGLKPNLSTHHLLISGYLKLQQTDKALAHLEEMKADGCRPTLVTMKLFEGTLDKIDDIEVLDEAIEEGASVKEAKRILELCEGKLWSTDFEEALSRSFKCLTNKLVKKVLQKMEVDKLKGFFAWAGKQTDYSHGRHEYRALIRRFLNVGMLDDAMEFLEEMWEKDVKILPNDFATLVYHSGKAGKMTKAKEAMDMMKNFGLNPDAKVYGAALSGHIEANDDEGVSSLLQNLSDVEEFNAAISAFARSRKVDSALWLVQAMEEKGCQANVSTYNLLVKCLCSNERTDEALEALENMREKGLVPDVATYNVLIKHCCVLKKIEAALKLFSQMKETGCKPDIVTHNTLISGYLLSRQVEKAHQHVELMKAEGLTPSRETSRLFVINLSMTEELDKALKEFEKARESGKIMAIDACNCLLKGLIKAGKMDAALKVYENMKGVADMSTYVVMLRGCCNLSKFDAIEQLLAEARTREIQLPVSTYVFLLQTYSDAKINKKVASTFLELQNSGHSLDGPRTNSAVLDALSRGCQLETGVKFCKHLVDRGAKINARQLKYFFRLLVKSGRAGEAAELSKKLLERGSVIAEKSELQAA